MRPNGSLPWIAGLIVGMTIVSMACYSTYRSMESDSSGEVISSVAPSSSPPDSRNPAPASRTVPDIVAPVPSLPISSSAPTSAPPSPTNQRPIAEEVVEESSPSPPPPIPGAFAAAKVTNVPGVDQERLADIAQDFADKVKAAGWDTTSPGYHEAWKKAAEESEDSLKTVIGVQAWQELKMRQAQED